MTSNRPATPKRAVAKALTLTPVRTPTPSRTAAKAPVAAPSAPAGEDIVEALRGVLSAIGEDAERAAEAARQGKTDQALWAAYDMQRRVTANGDLLKRAVHARRSKRVPPETRQSVAAAAAEGIVPLAAAVRRLAVELQVRKKRQEAIANALRARVSAPARVYTASGGAAATGRGGGVRANETVRHVLAIRV